MMQEKYLHKKTCAQQSEVVLILIKQGHNDR